MVNNKIIWSDGLLLHAQHFQQAHRALEHQLHQQHAEPGEHRWGFHELTLDTELLNIGKLGLRSARGLFQDGTPFHMPEHDPLPAPMDIPAGLSHALIYLALPLRNPNQSEIAYAPEDRKRYTCILKTIQDVHSAEPRSLEIKTAALSTTLLTESNDLNSHTTLPIACIEESQLNFNITLSKTFLIPTLNIQTIPALQKLLFECHTLLSHRATMLATRLTDTHEAGTAEVMDLMLLQIINKYQTLMHYWLLKTPLHPETFFQTLIQLVAEMAAFTNHKRRPMEPPMYRHDHLHETFESLFKEVRQSLSMVLEQNAISIKLTLQNGGLWSGAITDKKLIISHQFILAIYADIPSDHLRTQISAQLKIAPLEHIKNLISRALPGIEIYPLPMAPRQIPYHANFTYFSLNQQNLFWSQLLESAGIALHAGENLPGLKFELWAIKQETETKR